MNFQENTALDEVLTALFLPYKKSVTDVEKITKAMVAANIIADENEIVNDHIAFRTLGVPNLGIASFEKIFLHYITVDPIDTFSLNDTKAVGNFFYEPLWQLPTLHDYQLLSKESEYAAWVIYNRYYLNHYTISVHELPEPYNSLEAFNVFLEDIGIVLNSSGGKIKTSKDGLLRQTSSVAKMVEATFANNEKMKISGSYVEFAERSILPEYKSLAKEKIQRKHRREGFEAANADKIFESTYNEQTLKNTK